jgi:hypothetical protein
VESFMKKNAMLRPVIAGVFSLTGIPARLVGDAVCGHRDRLGTPRNERALAVIINRVFLGRTFTWGKISPPPR